MQAELDFDSLYRLMEASFPPTEFRTYEGQKRLLEDKRYRVIAKKGPDGQTNAFIAVWEFPEFRFLEHTAVDPSLRGQGVGGRMLSAFAAESSIPVLLEVEPPETEWASRRIGFYERLGFTLNPYPYEQPPLRKNQAPLPLLIMSHLLPLTESEFLHFRDTVYREVYRVPAAEI
ncbi:GNAT family N-acetyltransferase [Paenibacillus sp. HN-1]|uniref:GNAT family N-acetyltransferase n=1 Tax=Paenibacillus TaxID=44249 RepID=UPI001CA894CA|nr:MULTISPECIES: GNAT family N-acetyltransferase [Paenibacillus]MBY9081135.1 GNAT family N-acetyltransferase [Paenibacillus sp. CGMCC 1.18879]MBY9087172.1 GNAT family N-acetyltransferase [Paenibacillus sinensis]